jgi:excisionase family DNA binding protein
LSAKQPPATSALFVRIPQVQAQALDRLAFESRRPKQAVVSELLASALDRPAGRRRAPVALPSVPEPVLGWHSFRANDSEVLTLEEVAELLAVAVRAVVALVGSGELPGREIDGQWRFARAAVLAWLAHAPVPADGDG